MPILKIILWLLVTVTIVNCQDQLNKATLNFVTGSSYSSHQTYSLDGISKLIKHPKYDGSRTTILYIHGFSDSKHGLIPSMVSAFSYQKNRYNLIILDWKTLARGKYYTQSMSYSNSIGKTLGRSLLAQFKNGNMNEKRFYVVGHGLGAQMAATIGREIKSGGKSISRITGLDPVRRGFSSDHKTLNKHDADFVDIIHSNADGYGISTSTGTADFWPNGGKHQPGCGTNNNLCSHVAAVTLYEESVKARTSTPFLSAPGRNIETSGGKRVSMGIYCPRSARGDYHTRTGPLA